VSRSCSTAKEGWPKTSVEGVARASASCSTHSDVLSLEKDSVSSDNNRGGPFSTRANNVDSEGAMFRWSEWSPRVTRLNAPREDGAKLIEPPLRLAGEIASVNQQTILGSDYDLQGRTLPQLAREARQQLLAEALRYTQSYRDVAVPANPSRLILAGHQPEMFHPGVWFKNFALAQVAKDQGAVAVNLQIDSDTMKAASLRVPGASVDHPRLENVSFDKASAEAPFEQRAIIDRACFESFGQRAGNHLRSLVPDALLARYWPLVVARSREVNNVGAAVSQARHQCEGNWGLQTLEIPQSHVCDLPAMRWFIVHLLTQLPRFWDTYNSALLEYRREHKVRSAAHPVPELDSIDNWLEAPLWIWSEADPRRRPLYVRLRGDELVLSDRDQIEVALSVTPEGDAGAAVEQLGALTAQGIRLRTRALITTMAARLLLGDLFIHGIGGAKYDQLTDRIIERFFGLTPPGYMVVSGTLHLPIASGAAPTEDVQQMRQRIRELEFHPERFLEVSAGEVPVDQKTAALITEKRRLLAMEENPANARERCRAIRQANEALQPAVAALQESWTSQANQRAEQQRWERLLGSREYAFALFPETILTKFLLSVLEISDRSG
jgi:hypothetical protein